jgi:diacylglycerol kinase (ATP)
MRVVLLHNPGAGNGGNHREALLGLLKAHGHRVEYASTKGPDWKRMLKRRAGLIVVAGGDGTVAKVLRRLDEDAPPVAIIPVGSANNIARCLGICTDAGTWIGQWSDARLHSFHRPRLVVDGRERNFVEAVGIGVFPKVIADPDSEGAQGEAKVERGATMFARQVRTSTPGRWRLELDGEVVETRALMIEVLNVPLIGPRLNLSPSMRPGDSTVDVVELPQARRAEFARLVGNGGNGSVPMPLPMRRVRHVAFDIDGAELHVDDELWPRRMKRHARVEVHAGGSPVRLLRP